jgi:hypothetical protein
MDAWEVASGKEIFELVAKSGLPMLANSDLHHPSQISSWKTAFHCERHPEAIMKAIKQQDLDFRFYSDELVQPTYAQIKHFSAPLKVANSF